MSQVPRLTRSQLNVSEGVPSSQSPAPLSPSQPDMPARVPGAPTGRDFQLRIPPLVVPPPTGQGARSVRHLFLILTLLTDFSKGAAFGSIPPLPTHIRAVGPSPGIPPPVRVEESLFDELMRGIPHMHWMTPQVSDIPARRVCLHSPAAYHSADHSYRLNPRSHGHRQ